MRLTNTNDNANSTDTDSNANNGNNNNGGSGVGGGRRTGHNHGSPFFRTLDGMVLGAMTIPMSATAGSVIYKQLIFR